MVVFLPECAQALKRSQPQIPPKEARASFPFLLFKRNKVANTVREGSSSQNSSLAKNNFNTSKKLSATHAAKEKHASFPCTKLKGSDKPAQLSRFVTGACRSTDRLVQKPNQPRLLSTSYNSWHNMSNAVQQLKATCATSQSCRKRSV